MPPKIYPGLLPILDQDLSFYGGNALGLRSSAGVSGKGGKRGAMERPSHNFGATKSGLNKTRRSPDSDALKLGKGRSGYQDVEGTALHPKEKS